MKKLDLAGIIPAPIVPMTKDYEIDETALRTYIRWLLVQKPKGFAVNVDTGEGAHLFIEEKKRIVSIYKEEVKGEVPIVAGLYANFTKEAVQQAQELKKAGADAVLVAPIPAYQGSNLDLQIPYLYHKAIAEQADIPIVLFRLQKALAGKEYEREIIEKLVSINKVVAIKEATFDALKFKDAVSLLRDTNITILTGNDNFLLESFILGATGALLGIGAIGIKELKDMLEGVNEKNFAKAFAASEVFQPLTDVIFGSPVRDYRARTKEALVMMGVIKNATVRPPLLPISAAEKEVVKQALRKAKYI